MNKDDNKNLQKQSIKYLSDLFKRHGVSGKIEEEKLIFDRELVHIETYSFLQSSDSNIMVLQLDICIYYSTKAIVESFAGFGNNYETANIDALENFTSNSFHTILSAFFTSKYDDQIEKDNWVINNKDFEVCKGNISVRGNVSEYLNSEWFNQFEAEIKKLPLEEGIHWIRLFYSHGENQKINCEVLLDNEICHEIVQKNHSFSWQRQDEFFSIRLFLILKNGIDFSRVVKLIGSELSQDEIFIKLEKLGLSKTDAEKAYSFIQEAFGRKLIQDMEVQGDFLDEAIIINNRRKQFNINLKNEKIFQTGTKLAIELTKNGWDEELKKLAMTSASFNALNEGLNNGIKLEEVDCSFFKCTFLIPSYPAITVSEKKKPFWKIW